MDSNKIVSAFQSIDNALKKVLYGPLKICVVCNPGMGGSGIVGTSVASALSHTGHDVHIVTYSRPYRLADKSLKTHFVPAKQHHGIQYFPVTIATASKLYDVVRDNKIEIINVHYAIPYTTASYLAREMFKSENVNIPIVTTVHGTDIHTIGQKKEFKNTLRFTLKSSDGITAVCEYLKKQIKDKFDIDSVVRVIYNHVDTERFRKANIPSMKNRLGKSMPIILHASNFRPIKNIGDIIDAFCNVRKTVPSRLVLVGKGPDKEKIINKVKELGLAKDVTFAGARRDIEKFYAVSDVFVMASLREGCPLSILEAMSSSVPVVSTNVGGIPEIVDDGKTGMLVSVGDTEKIADKIIGLLSDDKMRWKFGKAARARVMKKFTAEKIVPQYESYYRELMLI